MLNVSVSVFICSVFQMIIIEDLYTQTYINTICTDCNVLCVCNLTVMSCHVCRCKCYGDKD